VEQWRKGWMRGMGYKEMGRGWGWGWGWKGSSCCRTRPLCLRWV